MEIFTKTEKNIIQKEFTYNDTARLNWNEWQEFFTEHGLDSTCNSLIKNCSTKSVILAPFNSTKTHISSQHSSVIDLVDNQCLILHERCRDWNRQYENNFNSELDNGVYNKHVLDTDPDKQSEKSMKLDDVIQNDSFNESKIASDEEEEIKLIEKEMENKNRDSELWELERMIERQNQEDRTHGRSTSNTIPKQFI